MRHETQGSVALPIVDPYGVQDVVADQMLSIEVDGSSNLCTLVFGKRRARQVHGEAPAFEAVVVSRVVITLQTLDTMMTRLLQMNQAAAQVRPEAVGAKPN